MLRLHQALPMRLFDFRRNDDVQIAAPVHGELFFVTELQPAGQMTLRAPGPFCNCVDFAAIDRVQRENAIGFPVDSPAQDDAGGFVGALRRAHRKLPGPNACGSSSSSVVMVTPDGVVYATTS